MATYVDSSVVLAYILQEPRRPTRAFWSGELTTSRLTEYEVYSRLHRLGRSEPQLARAAELIGMPLTLDLSPEVLERARHPFPVPLRTLDALHLASADWLRREGFTVEFATYDARLRQAALVMGFPVVEMGVAIS
ncbi:MAG: type II toxin-antitoxin system VapC family toxin [Gemmatimonadales bacterium]